MSVLRPGFASAEPEEAQERIESPIGHAHYDGLTDVEAAETFKRETLCGRCLCAGVCRVAAAAEGPMVVVSRCLSFIPGNG